MNLASFIKEQVIKDGQLQYGAWNFSEFEKKRGHLSSSPSKRRVQSFLHAFTGDKAEGLEVVTASTADFERVAGMLEEQGYMSLKAIPWGAVPSMFSRGVYVGEYPHPFATAVLPQKEFYGCSIDDFAERSEGDWVFIQGTLDLEASKKGFPHFVLKQGDNSINCYETHRPIPGLDEMGQQLIEAEFPLNLVYAADETFYENCWEHLICNLTDVRKEVVVGGRKRGTGTIASMYIDTVIVPDYDRAFALALKRR